LLPLHGAFLIIGLASLAVRLWALIDAATHPDAAYVANEKQSKTFWIVILVVALLVSGFGLLSVLGLIAAIVYLVDVRPAVRGSRGRRGGSSSDGPYGPYRG
jgi:hypothetical protein